MHASLCGLLSAYTVASASTAHGEKGGNMKQLKEVGTRAASRRSFLKNSVVAGAAATVGAGILSRGLPAFASGTSSSPNLSDGDIAILQFLAAAEIIETDLWQQYEELGGINTQSPYVTAFENLDSDGPQYITSNTLDE